MGPAQLLQGSAGAQRSEVMSGRNVQAEFQPLDLSSSIHCHTDPNFALHELSTTGRVSLTGGWSPKLFGALSYLSLETKTVTVSSNVGCTSAKRLSHQAVGENSSDDTDVQESRVVSQKRRRSERDSLWSKLEALVLDECQHGGGLEPKKGYWGRRASAFVSGCTQIQLLEETIRMVKSLTFPMREVFSEQSGLAVFALEGPDCAIRHASSSFAERVGWFAQGEPLEGCSILPIIHPDDIAAFLDFTRAAALAVKGITAADLSVVVRLLLSGSRGLPPWALTFSRGLTLKLAHAAEAPGSTGMVVLVTDMKNAVPFDATLHVAVVRNLLGRGHFNGTYAVDDGSGPAASSNALNQQGPALPGGQADSIFKAIASEFLHALSARTGEDAAAILLQQHASRVRLALALRLDETDTLQAARRINACLQDSAYLTLWQRLQFGLCCADSSSCVRGSSTFVAIDSEQAPDASLRLCRVAHAASAPAYVIFEELSHARHTISGYSPSFVMSRLRIPAAAARPQEVYEELSGTMHEAERGADSCTSGAGDVLRARIGRDAVLELQSGAKNPQHQ